MTRTLVRHFPLPATARERTTGAAALEAAQLLYLPFHEREPYADVALARDVRYGPHERHRLDIFAPTNAPQPLPILLFVHGGGFTGGDKKRPGLPYQDNIGLWAARHGLIGVNMTYRLAPQNRWPAVVDDIAAAVDWIKAHISDHGGAPDDIIIMGTSAGATHAATFIARQTASKPADVRGGILISGAYDLLLDDPGNSARQYFGDDLSLYAEASPKDGLLQSPVPLMVVVAEFDPPKLEAQALNLIDAYFEQRKILPAFTRLIGHNHFTTTLHINTGDAYFSEQISRFVQSVVAAGR